MKPTAIVSSFLCLSAACFAMDNAPFSPEPTQVPQEDAGSTIEVTETCAQNLKDINQDYGQLLYYFKSVFQITEMIRIKNG